MWRLRRASSLGGGLLALAIVAWATLADAQQASTATVPIKDIVYQPRTLTVPAGTTVTWINQDPFEHTVTADDGSHDSDLIEPDQSYSHTYTQAGTYPYYCKIHGAPGGAGQAGVVVVTAAQPAQPPPSTLTPSQIGGLVVALLILAGLVGLVLSRRRA